jgi:hypothetical protein
LHKPKEKVYRPIKNNLMLFFLLLSAKTVSHVVIKTNIVKEENRGRNGKGFGYSTTTIRKEINREKTRNKEGDRGG